MVSLEGRRSASLCCQLLAQAIQVPGGDTGLNMFFQRLQNLSDYKTRFPDLLDFTLRSQYNQLSHPLSEQRRDASKNTVHRARSVDTTELPLPLIKVDQGLRSSFINPEAG